MVTKKFGRYNNWKFWSPHLCQPPCGDQKNSLPSNTPPQLDGDQKKNSIAPKGMVGIILLKNGYYIHSHFLEIKNFYSPSNIPPSSNGDLKGPLLCYHFGKIINFMLHFPSWAIENFLLPFDGVGVLNGHWNFSVAIKGAKNNFQLP